MKRENVIVLPVPGIRSEPPLRSGEVSDAWTLVDFLFPANRKPMWSGSVSNDAASSRRTA